MTAFVELYDWFFVDTLWLVSGASRGFGCQHVEDLGRQAPGHFGAVLTSTPTSIRVL